MKTFTDTRERRWEIDVTVGTIRRVKNLTDVDLTDALKGTLFQRLAGDVILLVDVLYAVVKPQCDAQGVTDEQFGEALGGDVLDAATKALLEGIVDFFPSERRAVLAKALQKLEALQTTATQKASDLLDSGALDRLMQQELERLDAETQTLLRSATSSPGTSVSTPPG